MTNHRFTFEVKDTDDTILRDGETRTHKMMLRDSVTKTDTQIALDATEALKVRDAAILAASRKPGFVYSTTLDSQATARAASRQASYDAYDDQLRASYFKHAPVVTDAVDPRQAWHAARANRTADAADTRRATMDAAYAERDEELRNAWKKPAQF
jgi:hypothetical protein